MYSLHNKAKEVAGAGRFGDTTLIHVNQDELRGIASVVPLTINPHTGYPEAFLPALLGVAAPVLGTSLGMGMAGTMALGALGSGLGSLIQGGNMQDILRNAAMGGVGGALGSGSGAYGKLAGKLGLGGEAAGQAMGAGLASGGGNIKDFMTATSVPGFLNKMPVNFAQQAAPTVMGGASSGIGGLIKNPKIAAAAALPLLSMMGNRTSAPSDDKDKKRSRRGTSFMRARNPRFGGVSGSGIENQYMGFNHGGLVRGYAQGGPVPGPQMAPMSAPMGPAPGPMGPPPEEAQIVQEAKMAILGQHPEPEEAIKRFIEVFGEEAIETLVQEIKAELDQSDGMSDSIPAMDPSGPTALSEGEYVVPADVVSGLGNGSTDAGARVLDGLQGMVRGGPSQIDPNMVM